MKDLIVLNEENSFILEEYRTIRTNILFSNIYKNIKTIIITSSVANEGKSTVIANLATIFAKLDNKKVLIIDGDLRNPTIHKIFNISNFYGLTDILTDQKKFEDCINITELENLHVLTTGITLANPSEIIASHRMRAFINNIKELYDYIFIDLPPIGLISDVGSMAGYIDGTILLVAANEVTVELAKTAKKKLNQVGANILGVVINKYESLDENSYLNYDYYKNSYFTSNKKGGLFTSKKKGKRFKGKKK